jgi:beta-lactam-binding protein with PASTA domain
MRHVLFLLLALCLTATACGEDGSTSTTPGRGVAVPGLVGQTLDYARGALEAVGLTADVVTAEGAGLPAGQVTQQVPAPGTVVAAGSRVVVKVAAGGTAPTFAGTTTTTPTAPTTAASTTTGPDPASTSTTPPALMPDVVCWNLQDAQDEIQRAGVFWSQSRDATGAGRRQIIDANWLVVDQEPAPGTPIAEGEPLLMVVNYGEANPCGL